MSILDDETSVAPATPTETASTDTSTSDSSETGTPQIGPRPVSMFSILMRTVGGLGGGIMGAGVMFVIALVGSGILSTALDEVGGTPSPLFVFVFLAMIFLGSLTANLLGSLFMGFGDREHYSNVASSLYQIFFANVAILFVVAPVYLIVAGLDLNLGMLASVAALQVVVSAFVSALILEIIANHRYALVGVYSTMLSVLVSAGVYFLVYAMSSGNPLLLLLLALPVMWFSVGLFSGLVSVLYGVIYQWYGVDFLNSGTTYGDDVRWISEAEETAIEEDKETHKDVSGAAFLKNRH